MIGLAIVTKVPGGLAETGWETLLRACLGERTALEGCPRIWVALSGGADSTALLLALLKADLSIPISVSHIDHGVQTDAKRWADHCVEICERLGVPLLVHRLTPPADGRFPAGFEAWARSERYACWQQLLGRGELLLCAHHADDQTETIALRLLQGRLPLPMPKRRRLGAGTLLRPLLALPRAALRQALEGLGQGWLEDPSNQDPQFLRNSVRALLPQLAVDGNWTAALQRCGDLVGRQQRALKAELGVSDSDAAGELGRIALTAIPGAVALQGVLAAFGAGPVSRRQAADALLRLHEQAAAGETGGTPRGGIRIGGVGTSRVRSVGPAGRTAPSLSSYPPQQTKELRLFVAAREMVIWREPVFAATALAGLDLAPLVLPHGSLMVECADDGVESTVTEEPWMVRALTAADRLLLNGRQQPVKELLRASGVPRWARSSYPVVVAGEVILAVPAGGRLVVNGWLHDSLAPGALTRLGWRANLPS